MLALLISLFLSSGAATAVPPRAVRILAAGDTLEIENDWVRVWRSKRAPHEKTPMAEHLAHVVVYLTDAHQRMTGADGRAQDITQKAGAVAYRGGARYAEENVSDAPLEAIIVELKPGAPRSPRIRAGPS